MDKDQDHFMVVEDPPSLLDKSSYRFWLVLC